MIEAVQNHNPEIIIVDEIGTQAEVDAAKTIAQRGVSIIATAHGFSIHSLLKNPDLVPLLGVIQPVILSDKLMMERNKNEKSTEMKKTVLERKGAATFQML